MSSSAASRADSPPHGPLARSSSAKPRALCVKTQRKHAHTRSNASAHSHTCTNVLHHKAGCASGQCTLSLVLKNNQPGAYKHEKYGDNIVVERIFTTSGSNRYVTKAWDRRKKGGGRIVTRLKAEVEAIKEHYSIQVRFVDRLDATSAPTMASNLRIKYVTLVCAHVFVSFAFVFVCVCAYVYVCVCIKVCFAFVIVYAVALMFAFAFVCVCGCARDFTS